MIGRIWPRCLERRAAPFALVLRPYRARRLVPPFPLAVPHHTSVVLSEQSTVELFSQCRSECEYPCDLAVFFVENEVNHYIPPYQNLSGRRVIKTLSVFGILYRFDEVNSDYFIRPNNDIFIWPFAELHFSIPVEFVEKLGQIFATELVALKSKKGIS